MTTPRTLDNINIEDAKSKVTDIKVFGDGDAWRLICKASSDSQGWMKSTKAMSCGSAGVLVQVSTQQGDHIAEALQFLPGARLFTNTDGSIEIIG